MRYKVADHEVKLFCKAHDAYPDWYELDCGYDDGEGGPLDPAHWVCPGLRREVAQIQARQDAIDKMALVPLGKDYPVGTKKRVPMEQWPQALIDAWARTEEEMEGSAENCRESWEIEIVPITENTGV